MKTKTAFTLAEILVTLTVIGIVASITIPSLVKNFQNKHWKTEYKKAYSDLSQAVIMGVTDNSFMPRTTKWNQTVALANFTVLQSFFGKTKECYSDNNRSCWDGTGELTGGPTGNTQPGPTEKAFIDKSGRAWSLYFNSENIILVDVNGFEQPNKYGQDRWFFTYTDKYNSRVGEPGCTSTIPEKVMPYYYADVLYSNPYVCNYPPCYYKSWFEE